MSEQVVSQFGSRLADYVKAKNIKEFSVVYHGGEPLLYSAMGLVKVTEKIRSQINPLCELSFSVQTNGVLLTEKSIDILEQANIHISISLDGPRWVNDQHRFDHAGNSVFDETIRSLELLVNRPEIFKGVIGVINPQIPPRELFDFFTELRVPSLDLLLPDATYNNPPPGRLENPTLYSEWLVEAYKLWYEEYSDLPIRFFDGILGTRVGLPSPTDALGFGEYSLLVIDTDGSFTDHDVFKITKPGQTSLDYNIFDNTIEEVAHHPKLLEHNHLLSLDGVAPECTSCPIVDSCGSGTVMHRFHPIRGFKTPTIYCKELFNLFDIATEELLESISPTSPSQNNSFDLYTTFNSEFNETCALWRERTEEFENKLDQTMGEKRRQGSAAAASLGGMSSELSNSLELIEGRTIHTWQGKIRVQSSDERLILPFNNVLLPYKVKSAEFKSALSSLTLCEHYLALLSPDLPNAIGNLISDIIFVSEIKNTEGIFSFSDDKVPNVIYLSAFADGKKMEIDDIADSILHEFLHQVLFHLVNDIPLLYDYEHPRFPAPWREGMRPSGGFLHGTYVFTCLSKYWDKLSGASISGLNLEKARRNAENYKRNAIYGINALSQFGLVTSSGKAFLNSLAKSLGCEVTKLEAPGIIM